MECGTSTPEPLTVLFGDQSLDQLGDGLLAARRRVQLAAHLGETPIDVGAEVTEVLPQSIETRRRGVSEVADLGSDLGDVPIGCAGQHPGRRGVLLGCAEPPIEILEIILTHRLETTGGISARVHLISGPVDTEQSREGSGHEHDLDGRFHHRLRCFIEGGNSGDDRTGIQPSGRDEF